MIITRTADTVDFQLSETRRVVIDVAQVVSASLVIGRDADGRLAPAIDLLVGSHLGHTRIEAGLAELGIMHARIVEMMQDTAGPTMSRPGDSAPACEDYPD